MRSLIGRELGGAIGFDRVSTDPTLLQAQAADWSWLSQYRPRFWLGRCRGIALDLKVCFRSDTRTCQYADGHPICFPGPAVTEVELLWGFRNMTLPRQIYASMPRKVPNPVLDYLFVLAAVMLGHAASKSRV